MAKQARSFRYQARSLDDMKERANSRPGDFDSYLKPSTKVYKAREGKNLVRILPATWEDARHYGYDIWLNYQVGVDNGSYLSLKKMLNKPDPIEEARVQAKKDGEEELAKQLTARPRILMYVIDRLEEDAGPQIWPCPYTVDKAVIDLSFDEDDGSVKEIDHPETGCDLRFYKEGKGLNTDYPAAKMRLLKASPISDDQELVDEWLRFIQENPVPQCLNFYSYEHIANVFDGNASSKAKTDDDDDEEEKPAKKGAGKRVAAKAEPEDHDDDDYGEKPASRKGAKAKLKAEPDEDDDDAPFDKDEEAEDAEPAPRQRGRARPQVDETDDEETPAPKRGRARVAEPEEDDEEPAPRKGAKGKLKAEPEEEDDEDAAEEADEEPAEKPSRAAGIRERIRAQGKRR